MHFLQDFYSLLHAPATVAEIQVLDSLREFWASNKDFWFSHAPIAGWKSHTEPYTQSWSQHIHLILHYDQLFRHPNPTIKSSDKPHAFRFATALALRLLSSPDYATAEEWEQVFVLLCVRHNASLGLKELALRKLHTLIETRGHSPLLLRFLKATVLDIHECKKSVGFPAEPIHPLTDLNTYQSILQSPVCIPGYTTESIHSRLRNAFRECLNDLEVPEIAVSISGGVDSMVAARIAKEVCGGKSLRLLHIAYNNRDSCPDEINLLRDFSQRLGVPLHVLQITELKRCRSSEMRSLYEDVTRQMRFSFYRQFNCPVILGHNQDDCLENVFQNLSKQIHMENLFGMKQVGHEQGVTIVRPMLEIAKKDIVLYADHTGIPHLYDSTPAWSRRGQMRDRLLPGIHTFDPAILPGLVQFVKHAQFLQTQWTQSFATWMGGIVREKNTVQIPRDAFFVSNASSLAFWVQIWQSLNLPRPSNKSLQNFMGILQRGNAAQCILSGNIRATLDEQWIQFHLCN
jgi:tRNA(Ile)-lysidine synthetase-like protein